MIQARGLTFRYYAWMIKYDRDKHSSLLVLSVSVEGKEFYNIDTWAQSYKTFYGLYFHIL